MTAFKRLYLVVGFDDPDVERRTSDLQRKYEAGSSRFVARRYPTNEGKRVTYLKAVVEAAIDIIFGPGGATNFCRRQDQSCALEAARHQARKALCEHAKVGATACARSRPQLIVVICADHLFDEVLTKLGRGTLIMRLSEPKFPSINILKDKIDAFEKTAAKVILTVTNRRKSLLAPLIPYYNFQCLGGYSLTSDIQAAPESFAETLEKCHEDLYRENFKNPVKPQIRGAYMLDDHTGFQQDHLHSTVQTIGSESRTDSFHLINAYHVYGVKSDPGFHFDVMNVDGGAIRHTLVDSLTEKKSRSADTHLNATPCGRLL